MLMSSMHIHRKEEEPPEDSENAQLLREHGAKE
jgi:hypothetical protein